MLSQFGTDLENINLYLQESGKSLELFTKDGKLNLESFIRAVSDAENKSGMMGDIGRIFGTAGTTPLLLLSQNMESYKKYLAMQTGDTAGLGKGAIIATDTIAGNIARIKNLLSYPIKSEGTIKLFNDLIVSLKDNDYLGKLANEFGMFMRDQIRWWRDGHLGEIVKLVRELFGVFRKIMPSLQFFGGMLIKIFSNPLLAGMLIFINRLTKMGTLLNTIAITSSMIYMMGRGGVGRGGAMAMGMLGIPSSSILLRGTGTSLAGAATVAGMGRTLGPGITAGMLGAAPSGGAKLGRGIVGGVGFGGAGTLLGIGPIGWGILAALAVTAAGSYAYIKQKEKRDADYRSLGGKFDAAYRNNTYIFNGDVWGSNNIKRTIEDMNTSSYKDAGR
jgi:hypothetical protein